VRHGIDLLGFGDAPDFGAFFDGGKWESERDEPDRWTLDIEADAGPAFSGIQSSACP
jgi:hypothetical protein